MTAPFRFPHDVPTLTDGVVTLRAHRADDAQGSWEQCQDPLSQEWTQAPVPYSMEDARRFVGDIMPGGWRTDHEWSFAIEAVGPDGAPAYGGTISLRNEGADRAEVAFGSHPWIRGRGYAERALRLIVEWGFEERRLRTIIWWANEGNWSSRRLAWRLGFRFADGSVDGWLPHREELRNAWVGTLQRDQPREPHSLWLDCPRIVGQSVVLRSPATTDEPRIIEACADERTSYWLGHLPTPYTAQDARDYVASRVMQRATGSGVTWAVADPTTDAMLAAVSIFDLKPGLEAEIGYWTHPDARGRGVMTEACRLALRHAFVPEEDGGLGIERVRIFAAEENTASRRVIEANGFTHIGRERRGTRVRDGLVDTACYDMLRGEFSVR